MLVSWDTLALFDLHRIPDGQKGYSGVTGTCLHGFPQLNSKRSERERKKGTVFTSLTQWDTGNGSSVIILDAKWPVPINANADTEWDSEPGVRKLIAVQFIVPSIIEGLKDTVIWWCIFHTRVTHGNMHKPAITHCWLMGTWQICQNKHMIYK